MNRKKLYHPLRIKMLYRSPKAIFVELEDGRHWWLSVSLIREGYEEWAASGSWEEVEVEWWLYKRIMGLE
jgi:hypothetical protein